MTERQIDIMTNLSVWQRTIDVVQGVLDSVDTPAANRAMNDLDTLSSQIYTFMLNMMMTKDGEQNGMEK